MSKQQLPSKSSRSRLCLKPVPTTLVQQAGREVKDSDIHTGHMCISTLQPDIVGISLRRGRLPLALSLRSYWWTLGFIARRGCRIFTLTSAGKGALQRSDPVANFFVDCLALLMILKIGGDLTFCQIHVKHRHLCK
jgi:hypothetical protein